MERPEAPGDAKRETSGTMLGYRLLQVRHVASRFEESLLEIPPSAGELRGQSFGRLVVGVVEAVHVGLNLPNLFRRSLFLSLYSILEHHLDEHARALQAGRGLGINLSDLRGHGIERAARYIKGALGQSFPDSDGEWQVLKRFGQIRNILVHRFGRLEPKTSPRDAELEKWVKSYPRLGLVPLSTAIYMEAGFIDDAASVVERFFVHLGYEEWLKNGMALVPDVDTAT